MNAFLFPGQGSQEVGMGKDLYNTLPAAKSMLDNANEVLGYDLKNVMFNSSIEKLTDTRYAQPAIFTCSAMHLEKAKAEGIDYDYVAGHSLGEYSALYAAGVFSFEDALRLVNKRGAAMTAQNGKGSMIAVLGLTEDELSKYLNDSVVMANLNSKTQVILSGTIEGLESVEQALGSRVSTGEIKIKNLKVSGAFHSPQMADAAAVMKNEIDNVTMSTPRCYVVSNTTGRPTMDLTEIKNNLIDQMTCQVRWFDSINAMVAAGVDQFYEVGHGKVLRKMNKTIVLKPRCLSI